MQTSKGLNTRNGLANVANVPATIGNTYHGTVKLFRLWNVDFNSNGAIEVTS